MIEGKYPSVDAVIDDPNSTTRDALDFGGNAEDAVLRCNADKASVQKLLKEP